MLRKTFLIIGLSLSGIVFMLYHYCFIDNKETMIDSEAKIFVENEVLSVKAQGNILPTNQYSGIATITIPYIGEIFVRLEGNTQQKFIIENFTSSTKQQNNLQKIIKNQIKKENIISSKSLVELSKNNGDSKFQYSLVKKRYGRDYIFSGILVDGNNPQLYHPKIEYKGSITLNCLPGIHKQKLIRSCTTKGLLYFLIQKKKPLTIRISGTSILTPKTI